MRQRVRWLGLGLVSLAASVLAYVVLVRTRPGQAFDANLMSAVLRAVPSPVGPALAAFARPLLFYGLVPLVGLLALLALARGRWAAALTAGVVATVPVPVSLYLREHLLTRPELAVGGYDLNTFPSTHAAAAFGLLASLLLVWPRPADRGDVARASFVAALVGLGNITSHAHRPADVLGSLLLVCAVVGLTVAVLGFKPARPRRRRARRRSSPT